MPEHLKLANPSPPRVPEFVPTSAAKNILMAVNLIRTQPDARMAMVCGVPGCGKSTTLEMLERSDPSARLITLAPKEGSEFGIAENIVDRLGLGIKVKGSTVPELRQLIGQHLKHAGIWLMLDEAQYLTKDGADWIRILCGTNGTDLLLAGDLRLARMIEEMPMLQSRMLLPVIIEEVTEADVRDLAQVFGVTRKTTVTLLHRAALIRGGLRTVNTALMITQAGSEVGAIDEDLVPAALMEIGFNGKRGAQ